jgi:hypothetical protein
MYMMHPSSGLKMDASCTSETLATLPKSIRCEDTEAESTTEMDRLESLK